MGIRAALENVMVNKVDDTGIFNTNMDAFQAAGYLSVRQKFNLETILEAGHATIHRGWVPTDDDIITLLDISESIIEIASCTTNPPTSRSESPQIRAPEAPSGSTLTVRPVKLV